MYFPKLNVINFIYIILHIVFTTKLQLYTTYSQLIAQGKMDMRWVFGHFINNFMQEKFFLYTHKIILPACFFHAIALGFYST